MSGKRTIQGLWWAPDRPEERWIGTLRLAAKKTPRLRITIPRGHGYSTDRDIPLLHGCDEHGKPITLFFTGFSGSTAAGELTNVTYSAGHAILGIHLRATEDLVASSFRINAQHLFDWIARTGFQKTQSKYPESEVRFKLPEPIEYDVSEGLKIAIRASSYHKSADRLGSITEDAFLEFESVKGLSLLECQKLVTAVRHLLHFAILKRIFTVKLACEVEGIGTQLDDVFAHREIELCSSLNREALDSEIQENRWVFRFPDVQHDFGDFFGKWVRFLDQFDEAIGCYFTTVYHPLPHSVQHLCLTQALDAYHGIKHSSHSSNDFGLKVREIAELRKEDLPGVFDDAEDFALTVQHNRNYYTHHNPKWLEKGRIVTGTSLFRLNERLQLLFQATILSELGIPMERFGRLRRQLATKVIEYKF